MHDLLGLDAGSVVGDGVALVDGDMAVSIADEGAGSIVGLIVGDGVGTWAKKTN